MALFGKTTTRLEELEKALSRDSASRQFLALADEQRRAGQLKESIETLRRGLQFHPGYVAAHVAFGRACQQEGRFEEALEAYVSALSIDRENLVALRQAADLFLKKGEKIEAVKKLKLYRVICPGDKEVTETIERLDVELGFVPEERTTGRRFVRPLPPEAAPLPASAVPQPLEEPFGDFEEPTLLFAKRSDTKSFHPVAAVEAVETVEAIEGPAEVFAFDEPGPPGEEPPVRPPTPEPPVTETLAELFAAQGYVTEARAAFEALARQATDASRAERLLSRARSLGDAALTKAARLKEWADRLARSRPVRPEEGIEETLRLLVAEGGIRSAVLTDNLGLPVVCVGEGASLPGSPEEVLVAELTAFCKAVRRSRDDVGAGDLEGMAFSGPGGGAIVARVSPTYALILRTEPGASRGRARFLAARAAERLAPALS